ncbi:hypothetical protein [Acidihalobacter yilgarnensis]|uniref:hypothetical protein n=1 Tax=Acidihalobacter yilgarnensis TaxID=2819280 RepID=UPI0012EA792B|nr:hypothetical protein [Acidihalobacter yilgarnensis]
MDSTISAPPGYAASLAAAIITLIKTVIDELKIDVVEQALGLGDSELMTLVELSG